MKKIKVLYITNTGTWSGASIALKNIWIQLNERIEIVVVFPGKGDFSEYTEKMDYKCYYIKYNLDIWPAIKNLRNIITLIPRAFVHLMVQYKAQKKLCKIIHTQKPDVVHTNVGPLQFAAKAAKKCHVPHVWHIREFQAKKINGIPYPSFPSYTLFRKHLNDSFNIAITKAVAQYFNLKSNFKVIYDGVISERSTIPEISFANSEYLLYVGRLEANKGWKDALTAFINIANDFPEIRLVFAGAFIESEVNDVKRNIIPSVLQKRIEFLGFRSDCNELMRKARALLVPSYFEGFGFITAEGMYNGCVVIGRNTTGTKEQFDNGLELFGKEIGLRFNTQSEFEEQIKLVLSKPKLHFKEMLINAQNSVLKLYSIGKNAEDIFAIYNEILK